MKNSEFQGQGNPADIAGGAPGQNPEVILSGAHQIELADHSQNPGDVVLHVEKQGGDKGENHQAEGHDDENHQGREGDNNKPDKEKKVGGEAGRDAVNKTVIVEDAKNVEEDAKAGDNANDANPAPEPEKEVDKALASTNGGETGNDNDGVETHQGEDADGKNAEEIANRDAQQREDRNEVKVVELSRRQKRIANQKLRQEARDARQNQEPLKDETPATAVVPPAETPANTPVPTDGTAEQPAGTELTPAMIADYLSRPAADMVAPTPEQQKIIQELKQIEGQFEINGDYMTVHIPLTPELVAQIQAQGLNIVYMINFTGVEVQDANGNWVYKELAGGVKGHDEGKDVTQVHIIGDYLSADQLIAGQNSISINVALSQLQQNLVDQGHSDWLQYLETGNCRVFGQQDLHLARVDTNGITKIGKAFDSAGGPNVPRTVITYSGGNCKEVTTTGIDTQLMAQTPTPTPAPTPTTATEVGVPNSMPVTGFNAKEAAGVSGLLVSAGVALMALKHWSRKSRHQRKALSGLKEMTVQEPGTTPEPLTQEELAESIPMNVVPLTGRTTPSPNGRSGAAKQLTNVERRSGRAA